MAHVKIVHTANGKAHVAGIKEKVIAVADDGTEVDFSAAISDMDVRWKPGEPTKLTIEVMRVELIDLDDLP